ncbi:MAG TPA: protein kinase [Bryobacteraceae bacterium]|nr:protein kinase [Bryobacteraceae bacterium]
MPLSTGSRFGPYEVISPLGAGGMGEVFRGHDSKLGRDVALKVLPESLATDADYIARFQREAQVLASLNHPNIAAIYGLEGRAIVMELVEGATLSERVALGPLSIEEAIGIARQIAEALEYAHEKGVIHRDLKPANVKITPDGVVKVLDFGLAKIAEGSSPPQGNPATSPTLTVRSATQAGVILGTAAYMAPEQARGQLVDRRADIWAFGAVLYEMLTAKMAFPGESITDILASVVKLEPDWDALPPSTPPVIRKLITRCLAKDRKRRLQAIGEARLVIEDYLADPSAGAEPAVAAALAPSKRRLCPWMALAVAGVLSLALAALSLVHFREAAAPERVLSYSLAPPSKSRIHTFALSPDGRYLALAAAMEGKRRLWVRPLAGLTAQELAGTEDAMYPFWSPDSRSIGFFAGGKLKRISVDGSPPQILCDAPTGRSGTWNRDGVIVFAASNFGPLQRVPAAGGVPIGVTKAAEGELHRFPVFLSDGSRFVYLAKSPSPSTTGVYLASLDGPPPRRLLADTSSASWLPPANGAGSGYLLFHRDRTLMAQPLDAKTLGPAGDLFPVAEQVSLANRDYVQASISFNGVLVYWSGGATLAESQLTWYDRSGKALGNVGTPALMEGFALSPDEKTIAVVRGTSANQSDLWLHELVRAVDTRFTFDLLGNRVPVWSPDGRRIVYTAFGGSYPDLHSKETSGTGPDETLFKNGLERYSCDWSKDGRTLLYVERRSKGADLWVTNMEGDRKPTPFLETAFNETQGQFSPDGRWVAYASDESGRYEVYVRPFPSGPGKWKISVHGGELPRWRHDGKELFYLSPERQLMATAVKAVPGTQPLFSAGSPQLLFDGRIPRLTPGNNVFPYAVAVDGKRFLVQTSLGETAETPLTVVVNWLAAVKK